MSVIVERQRVHEIKGDSVAKGEQGLLNLDPHNLVFYVGGYPSSFTVRQAAGRGSWFWECQRCLWRFLQEEEPVQLLGFIPSLPLLCATPTTAGAWSWTR